MAASSGIGAVENSERGFLFGNRLFRREIAHVQIPFTVHAVAIRVGLSEMVAGIEEQNRNPRQAFTQQVQNDHILGLKTAGDADRFFFDRSAVFCEQAIDHGFCGKRLEFLRERGPGHDFPFSGSEYVSRHLRITFMTRSTASSSVSSVMRTAKNESGPKIARTTCFWSVPSSSGQKTVM